jgi:hypothetical protein
MLIVTTKYQLREITRDYADLRAKCWPSNANDGGAFHIRDPINPPLVMPWTPFIYNRNDEYLTIFTLQLFADLTGLTVGFYAVYLGYVCVAPDLQHYEALTRKFLTLRGVPRVNCPPWLKPFVQHRAVVDPAPSAINDLAIIGLVILVTTETQAPHFVTGILQRPTPSIAQYLANAIPGIQYSESITHRIVLETVATTEVGQLFSFVCTLH